MKEFYMWGGGVLNSGPVPTRWEKERIKERKGRGRKEGKKSIENEKVRKEEMWEGGKGKEERKEIK